MLYPFPPVIPRFTSNFIYDLDTFANLLAHIPLHPTTYLPQKTLAHIALSDHQSCPDLIAIPARLCTMKA